MPSPSLVPLVRLRSGRRPAVLLVTALFGIVCAGTGLVDTFWMAPPLTLSGREAQEQEALRLAATPWDGTLARYAERQLSQRSVVRRAVLPYWIASLLAYLRTGREEIVVGKDGWLFLERRVDLPRGDAEENSRGPVAILSGVVRRLASLGVEVILLPVPPKIAVAGHALPERYSPRPGLYEGLLRTMASRGLSVLDVMAVWKRRPDVQAYCRTDTHWSWAGSALVAEEVARRTGTWVPPSERSTTLLTTMVPDAGSCFSHLGMGDQREGFPKGALAILRSGGMLRDLPRPELVGELFLDETSAVMQIGTSYTEFAPYPEYLAHFSEGRVRAGWIGGGGAFTALYFLLRARGGPHPPRWLVWEIPAHTLVNPAGGIDKSEYIWSVLPPLAWRPLDEETARLVGPGEGQLATSRRDGYPTASWRWRPGGWVHPGDGTVSVRVRGEVGGGPALVTVAGATLSTPARWEVGDGEVVVPILEKEPSSGIRVTVRTLSPGTTLRVESISLCWDLQPERAVAGTVNGSAARFESPPLVEKDATVALAADGVGANLRLRLRLVAGDGTEHRLDLPPLAGSPVILVSARALDGRRLAEVKLEPVAGATAPTLQWARLIPPTRPR